MNRAILCLLWYGCLCVIVHGQTPTRIIQRTDADLYDRFEISPDGKILVAGCDDYVIRLWDLTTGEPTAVLYEHARYVNAVAFSPDGTTLVTGSTDKTIKVFTMPVNKKQ